MGCGLKVVMGHPSWSIGMTLGNVTQTMGKDWLPPPPPRPRDWNVAIVTSHLVATWEDVGHGGEEPGGRDNREPGSGGSTRDGEKQSADVIGSLEGTPPWTSRPCVPIRTPSPTSV